MEGVRTPTKFSVVECIVLTKCKLYEEKKIPFPR